MPWWTWAALVFFGVAVLAAAVLVVLALLGMRRLAKTGAQVEAGLEDLARKSEELEARLAHADERTQLVERKLAHLDGSLERLSVLTWALGDVSRAVSDLRSTVMLRK